MNLPQSTINVDSGLLWEQNLNSALTIIDGHTHAPGSGIQITPAGLDINAGLPMNNHALTGTQAITFTNQLSLATLNSIYAIAGDLYFNDGSSNVIKMTSGGVVNATSSGISNGTATASFVSSVLVVNAASNTPANIQGGSILLGNNVAASKFLTLSPPAAMAANFSLTLPSLPSVTNLVTLDNSGNFAAVTNVDNVTIQLTSNTLAVTSALQQMLAPPGAIIAYGGSSAPAGWLLCNGSAVSRSTYSVLFGIIGTTFGAGNGATTFNLPKGNNLVLDPADVSATVTYAGIGTASSATAILTRVGADITINGNVVCGTPSATPAAIILPSGYVIDAANFSGNANGEVGRVYRIKAGASYPSAAFGPFVIYFDPAATDRVMLTAAGTATVFSPTNGNGLFTVGDNIPFDFTVPIVGFGAGSIIKT